MTRAESGTSNASASCAIALRRVDGPNIAVDALAVQHVARRFAPHFYDTYAIGVVDSGVCRVTTPAGAWFAQPGSLLCFAPGVLHRADVVSTTPYGYRLIYLSAAMLHSLAPELQRRSAPVFAAPVHADGALVATLRTAHQAMLTGNDRHHAESALVSTVRELLRVNATSAHASTPIDRATRTLVDTTLAGFSRKLGERVLLEEIADACGVNTFRLIRTFRRATGIAPYAYLVLMRVNRARALLEAGVPISRAALQCGFSDQSHLTRTFTRTFGVSPGRYRRAIGSMAMFGDVAQGDVTDDDAPVGSALPSSAAHRRSPVGLRRIP